MSAITSLETPWESHSGLEVETFIKQQIVSSISSSGGKIGYVEMVGTDLKFYDEEGGTVISTISLGGDVYNISIDTDPGQVFYILADETEKIINITPSTTVSAFGSSETEAFPEAYTYTVAVNTGNGYITRITGGMDVGETASFDIKPYIANGDNYIRVAVTGVVSGQTKTVVLTGTLTTLTMSCNHAWQNVWEQGDSYVITGIRFAGSLVKVLHVAIDGTELQSVTYSAGQSYTTTSTTYTIPSSAFPDNLHSGVHTVTLWMSAQGVSTPICTFYIMCAVEDDNSPMVAINAITPMAVNFTSSTLFGYAVCNADKAVFNLSAMFGEQTYGIASNVSVEDRVEGERYTFSYPLEIDTGVNQIVSGTLTVSATSYNGSTSGNTHTVTTALDNTYSYLATPGALFYLNAATRDNGQSNYQNIVNEMGASQDGNFAASYNATWTGFSWNNDGWALDPDGHKALIVPAGSSVTVNDFAPLGMLPSYLNGYTIEMLLQCAHPSNYNTPVFSMFNNGNGLQIYPTKIVVYGTSERSETLQSVNLSETRMTHVAITFTKNYEGVNSRNLVSVYINGISNINFSFDGSSSFGSGNFTIGQQDTDAYLYKMRIYGIALEPQAVFNNFLNSIIDGVEFDRRATYEDNDILEGGVIDYAKCKAAGFNTMIVAMDSDAHDIPSFNNQASFDGCSLKFEYADDPTKDVLIENVSLDGQGTTSKKYYRWNLRAKTNDNTTWSYADGTVAQGKSGYMAGPNYIKVDRITAKKNYASSMQGHKMGMTGLYNDLFVELGLNENLPDPDYRVAVYQFPFVGFKYIAANDTYQFIGLYTAGPDKGSKKTFGYASSYDHLLSLEGPNHAPRGTRFLHPWVDVTYSYQDETLKFGGEEGWDCDYVGAGLSSDKSTDAAAILALYESEWKPAYEIVFNCSPYIASISETGYASITAINNAISTFLSGSTNGVSNQLLSLYDASYELYFYRTSTQRFEKLSTVDSTREHNVVTYLYSNNYLATQTPTTAQLKAARAARFKAEMGNYWDLDQTLYHYCFCILYGVTDNFAKNTYPFKFLPLSSSSAGNRWGWREDDLDTVLATDNNGSNTKSYSVEHGDITNDGVEIYQGGNSAFWVLIRDNYSTEIRNAMIDLVNAAASIATTLGIQGDGLHNSLFNLTSYYCWDHSSKYFSATLYENDRRWSYLEPWLIDASAVYNNVPPLTQSLGDQYQAEMLWMERRIAYIFSKYRIGAFTGDNMGYNAIAFTLAQSYTFNVTPAIDLYPVISLANTSDTQSCRTSAGNTAQMTITADGQTTNYIHGGDWLASIGDISNMVLTSRGAGSDIAFSVNGARIQSLKIGDAVANNVNFNATTLAVSSPTITSIDARNTSTITNSVNLLECPRLRTVKFSGSSATGLLLPIGAKLTEVSFPASASTVFMHSLPFLTAQNLTLPTLSNINSLYVKDCSAIHPLDLIEDILDDSNNNLQYVTLIWKDTLVADSNQIDAMFELADLPGYVDYQDGSVIIVNGDPWLEGSISSNETISSVVYAKIEDTYPRVTLDFDLTKVYIEFADSNVESICLTNWDTDHSGVLTLNEARAVTNISTYFRNNDNLTSFNELRFFEGLTYIYGGNNSTHQAFGKSHNLESVILPKTVTTIQAWAFMDCTSLKSVGLTDKITTIGEGAFNNCQAFEEELNLPGLTGTLGQQVFKQCYALKKVTNLGSITSIGGANSYGCFRNCTSLEEFHFPSTLQSIGVQAFFGCTSLTSLTLNDGLKTIGDSAFDTCSSLTEVDFPESITTINGSAFYNTHITGELYFPNLSGTLGQRAFKGTSITKIRNLGSITTIQGANTFGAFQSCLSLTEAVFPNTLVTIGEDTFDGCSALTKVNLPSSLRTVGASAFCNCSNVVFTGGFENITTISANAFENTGEYEVYLRDLTSIGAGAFKEAKVTKVKIGPNLSVLAGGSNDGCFRANDYPAAKTSLTEVIIEGNSLREIGTESFLNRTALTTINLPTSIAIIGDKAFYNCPITNNINLPNLTSLGQDAFRYTKITKVTNLGTISIVPPRVFQDCYELTDVTLPATVTSIQNGQNFTNCSKLSWVKLLSTSVPTIGNGDLFNNNPKLSAFYVLPSLLPSYHNATNWKQYCFSRMFAINSNPTDDAIVKGIWFYMPVNIPYTETSSDYSITYCIEVDPYHPITFSGGFTYDNSSNHGMLVTLNQYNQYVGYYNATTNPRTITINNANVKYVRMTIKTSELNNCYVHDDTTNEYLWQGSNNTTVYE